MCQNLEERAEIGVRHVNQIQDTADGNFQLNMFKKNNDPNDLSLETANGIGYFPDEKEVNDYLAIVPQEQEVQVIFRLCDVMLTRQLYQ